MATILSVLLKFVVLVAFFICLCVKLTYSEGKYFLSYQFLNVFKYLKAKFFLIGKFRISPGDSHLKFM